MINLLVASAERLRLETSLAMEITYAHGFHAAMEALGRQEFDIAIVDLELEGRAGFYLLQQIACTQPAAHVVVLAGPGIAADSASSGVPAHILLRKPAQSSALSAVCDRLAEQKTQPDGTNGHSLIGISSGIRKIRRTITSLKDWLQPVLIVGETGTGKEVIASALHRANATRRGPLVTVDCGAISPALIENELFGHAKGAYTGAGTAQRGLLKAADGGTIFFDEIGDLPLECQSRLLRVLQEREIRPLGETVSVPIDVRVCAATNIDLEAAVKQKRFREDLFYRLSAMTVKVPPLRDRREDIPLLSDHFLHIAKSGVRISVGAHQRMMDYKWPGNVRELQNRLLRATALADRQILTAHDLIGEEAHGNGHPKAEVGRLHEIEKQEILRAIAETKNDVIAAARLLGIGKTTLYRRLRAYREGD